MNATILEFGMDVLLLACTDRACNLEVLVTSNSDREYVNGILEIIAMSINFISNYF